MLSAKRRQLLQGSYASATVVQPANIVLPSCANYTHFFGQNGTLITPQQAAMVGYIASITVTCDAAGSQNVTGNNAAESSMDGLSSASNVILPVLENAGQVLLPP